jgi:hypothetical protein
MTMTCNLCDKPIELRPDGRVPPWCPTCGVDLKSVPPAGAPSTPPPADPAPLSEQELKERFGKHNLAVGIFLFLWGTFVLAGAPQSGGDKVLRSHERIGGVIKAVQLASLLNGAVLFASGVALRRGLRWGYPVAVCCAIVMIVAGSIFLACFQYVGTGPTIEDGVARISFIRYNLDMLIGLVDGLGLLWFLSTRFPRSGSDGRA